MTPFTRAATICCVLLLALLTCSINAADLPVTPIRSDSEIIAWTDRYMANAVRFDHFSGALLIARDGKAIHHKAYGMANEELGVPNRLNTRFRIGSISKQFTAAAILQLQERGRLRIDDSICRYLDDCPGDWERITLRHLLNHTSGLVNFTRLPEASGNFLVTSHSHAEVVSVFRNLPLESPPGETYNYNNSGYYLLGMVIEKVAATPYADYVRENIFVPLGMQDTGTDDLRTIVRNRADSYVLGSDSVFRNAPFTHTGILFSIGGAYSTVDDLLLWEQALENGKLLNRASRELMFTPGKGNYGFGWVIETLGDCQRRYHDGGVSGFSASLQKLQDMRLTVIAISNRGDDGGIRVAYDVAGRICGVPATIRGIQSELVSLDAANSLALIRAARSRFARFDVAERKVEELGNYLVISRQKRQALEIFKVNAALYPDSANAHYKLAMAYRAVGEEELAAEAFRRSLRLDPAHKDALEQFKGGATPARMP